MLQEMIALLPDPDLTFSGASRSARAYFQKGSQRRTGYASGQFLDHFVEEPRFIGHACLGDACETGENEEKREPASSTGHSLFQELFFFCRVKRAGSIPGVECIYVETVVDRDSGLAFAKVYPAKSATNAVDILTSRVLPFFGRRGIAIKEIHTRRTTEYCGLLPLHPFENFLAASHIQHLEMDQSSRPYNYLCEQFYRFLLKEFFPLALRKKFQLSLAELQDGLDAFIEAYNSRKNA